MPTCPCPARHLAYPTQATLIKQNTTKMIANSRLAEARPVQPPEPPNASFPVFPADPARDSEGSGHRLAPTDAARRDDPPGGGRHLRVPAARLSVAEQGLPPRPRGTGPCGRDRDAHADPAA